MTDRRVIAAEILGTPVDGLAVWRSTDDPQVAGDLEGRTDGRAGDLLVLEIERDGFRWHVRRVLDAVPIDAVEPTDPMPPPVADPPRSGRRSHAHPVRPPGTVLIAWVPFGREVDEDAPGKHRPCIVLHSPSPDFLRVRPLYDPASAVARGGAPQVDGWRVAGLDKPSAVGEPIDLPVARCEQTLGQLTASDRRRFGVTRS